MPTRTDALGSNERWKSSRSRGEDQVAPRAKKIRQGYDNHNSNRNASVYGGKIFGPQFNPSSLKVIVSYNAEIAAAGSNAYVGR
jgi:hypothetical protein